MSETVSGRNFPFDEFFARLGEKLPLTADDVEKLEAVSAAAKDGSFRRGVTIPEAALRLGIQPHTLNNALSRIRLELHQRRVLSPAYDDTEALLRFYQEIRSSIL